MRNRQIPRQFPLPGYRFVRAVSAARGECMIWRTLGKRAVVVDENAFFGT
ncbi:hypothetical protein [[Clostridium] hylemonae]|nr:hypothetical protein [[Clostridium] hylemonae]